MSIFKEQRVYWIDDYVDGRRKREQIDPDGWLSRRWWVYAGQRVRNVGN